MTLALSYRQFVDSAAERHAARFRPYDAADDGDEARDDELAHDTVAVCRTIEQHGMIGQVYDLRGDE